ncbi:hypothetical protein BD414DRAFT_435643 [Trametes punicea]|nr:hypothetical protein BD414DRAFT_435643 [Trametes punicea]
MDGSRPGEAGVLAWCNSIRFNMAKDPGRQILHDQIQRQGFDFLDSYLENFFEGPKNEPVIELLKTPGRKKNASVRTRSAAAAAEKARTVVSLTFEDDHLLQNQEPMNEFQRALLRAKEKADEENAHQPLSQHASAERALKPQPFFTKLKSQKVVTIADSPISPGANRDDKHLDLEEDQLPLPAVVLDGEPPSTKATIPPEPEQISHESQGSIKELSMIAEDDEPAEGSRVTLNVLSQRNSEATQIQAQQATTSDAQEVPSGDLQELLDARPMDVEVSLQGPSNSAPESHEPVPDDLTSASANTFHSIPLDSPRVTAAEPQSTRTDDYHTAPLPKVSSPPVPVENDDPHSHTAPLPASSSRHQEYIMPLRDEPSAPVPGLSRKASIPQFAGLPAPSPLRKSLRVPGDPTAASGGAGALPGGKRTSWLSKARETKALETTAKRVTTLTHGLGLAVLGNNKRKSGEMLESARDAPTAPTASLKPVDEEQRVAKLPKLAASPADTMSDGKGKGSASSPDPGDELRAKSSVATTHAPTGATSEAADQDQDNVLGLLKKTTADLGTRIVKGAGKSLGGNAAAALAEARAKAEARVAERHKLEMGLVTDSEDVSMTAEDKPSSADPVSHVPESQRRLSVSDLAPSSQDNTKESVNSAHQPEADTSTSTTPPHSPPPQSRNTSFMVPSGPVFTKPPAPSGPRAPTTARSEATAPSLGRDFSFKLPNNPFSIAAAMTLGVGGSKFAPLSAQSSKGSIFSDVVFDSNNMSPHPAWMPSTQDTSYSAGGSQGQGAAKGAEAPRTADNDDLEEDDSWGVDEKFAAHHTWTPFGFSSGGQGGGGEQVLKDDTMTWSTIPSRSTSQRGGDTLSMPPAQNFYSALPQSREEEEEEAAEAELAEPQEGFAARLAAAAQRTSDADEGMNEEADMAMEIDDEAADERDEEPKSDLDEAVLAGKSTVTLVQQTKTDTSIQPRSESQQSMASTASSSQQSQLGFFGQASRLVSSVLGGSKKGKPEVKSLQLAAAAAKKQQEELEKKTARLKEMENRRQLAMQRKAEEEKARALEEERKIKEEAERRKREREEHTDKRPLRSTTTTVKKADDDNTKKRKIGGETSQKPPSKDKKDAAPPRLVKPNPVPAAVSSSKPSTLPKSALKQPASTVPATPGGAKSTATTKTLKPAASSSNLKSAAAKGKGPTREPSEQPDAAKSTKSAASAPQPGPPPEPPRVASESIELPEINSEYSDSDDEDRPRRDLPDWAQSPDVAAALQQQSTINPDDIFGRIGPLRMEEIFRTRQSRFRARTSSANWAGTDELTAEEEREYARRMGFR